MQQVIYADVLVFFNTVVTFILLLSTAQFSGIKSKASRLVIGSLVGGAYSLMILAPEMGAAAVFAARTAMAVTLVLIAFEPKKIKAFFRAFSVFLLCNFLYAGGVYAVFYLFSPSFMQVNNGYAYYDMSVTSVIISCAVIYLIILLLRKTVFAKKTADNIFVVDIRYNGKTLTRRALLDTGNGLKDAFNQKSVMILNSDSAFQLTGEMLSADALAESSALKPRLIPVKTVSGSRLLPVFTADGITVYKENGENRIENPEIAVTQDELGGESYSALISPDFL